MKTIIAISLFLGILNYGHPQEYLPLPEANSKWINTYSVLIWNPVPHFEISDAVNYCTPGIDTTINGLSYFKIDTCDNGGYKGALRNDNGKVWFIPKDSPTEFLLYDFTVVAGDTISGVYVEFFGGSYGLYDFYVGPSAVDSILIDGIYRKRIGFGSGFWIEGVGNSQGLFLEPWLNISDYMIDLFCMSADGTTLFPEFSIGECESPVGIEDLENDIQLISIYPNPCGTEVFIELKKSTWELDPEHLIIYNSFGQRINPVFQIAGNIIRVEMASFPNGIYFIGVSNNKNITYRRLIKK